MHPHPGGLQHQLRTDQTNPTLEPGGFSNGDSPLAHFGAFAHTAIEPRVLKNFLIECENEYTDEDGKMTSQFTKAVCIYDLLKYGPKADWTAA